MTFVLPLYHLDALFGRARIGGNVDRFGDIRMCVDAQGKWVRTIPADR
jgi:hypothetical protein